MSQSSHNEAVATRERRLGGSDENGPVGHVMSIVWASGKIGIATYDLETTEIFYLPDTAETSPDFSVLRLIYEQIRPKIVLVCTRQDDKLLNVIREITGYALVETIAQEDQGVPDVSIVSSSSKEPRQSNFNSTNRRDPNTRAQCELQILSSRDFAPEPGRRRVLDIRLQREPKDNTPESHKLFIANLIPLTEEIMMRALGALVRFMDKMVEDLLKITLDDVRQLPILDVKPITMYLKISTFSKNPFSTNLLVNLIWDKFVYVENSSWLALHIIGKPKSSRFPQLFKSEFSLFNYLNKTKTHQGAKKLKMMLLQPTRDLSLIKRRHDVIKFVLMPQNGLLLDDINEKIQGIKNFSKLLSKISVVHATVKEWRSFYTSLANAVQLGRLCSSNNSFGIKIFQEISAITSSGELGTIVREMNRVIDFESSALKKLLTPRAGIDETLDKRKAEISKLPEVMDIVATEELHQLPHWVKDAYVLSASEYGHLLSLGFEHDLSESTKLNIADLAYVFKDGERYFYRSPRTREMDITIGDIQLSILDLEIHCLIELTEFVMKYSEMILNLGNLVAELDALLAMGVTASDNNLQRPKIIEGNGQLVIKGGRHPLIQSLGDFTPNSTDFTHKLVVLTGPNASGKSVYLKQIGIIVLMALTGNFVPADLAHIPTYDRICTRIHALESISTGMSTFQIDLLQVNHAEKMATGSSLVLMDEFGKGTDEISGISLLAAFLLEFQSRGANCPNIFCSTHFHELVAIVQPSDTCTYQTMDFHEKNGQLIFLYKLKRGVCTFSYANFIARSSGIAERIIERSQLFDDYLSERMDVSNLHLTSEEWEKKKQIYIELGEEFFDLETDDQPPEVVGRLFREYMARLKVKLEEGGYLENEPIEDPNENLRALSLITPETPGLSPNVQLSLPHVSSPLSSVQGPSSSVQQPSSIVQGSLLSVQASMTSTQGPYSNIISELLPLASPPLFTDDNSSSYVSAGDLYSPEYFSNFQRSSSFGTDVIYMSRGQTSTSSSIEEDEGEESQTLSTTSDFEHSYQF